MNVKAFLSVSLAAILFSCCTDSHRVFDNPATIADNTTDNLHSLKVEKVEFTDTATVLSFKYTSNKRGYRLCISSGSVLSDEKGRTYKAKFFKEKPFDKYFKSTPEGMTLTVGFEPMPGNVRIFDYIGGVQFEDPRIFGISESPCKIKAPSYSGKEKNSLSSTVKGFSAKERCPSKGKSRVMTAAPDIAVLA